MSVDYYLRHIPHRDRDNPEVIEDLADLFSNNFPDLAIELYKDAERLYGHMQRFRSTDRCYNLRKLLLNTEK